MLKIPKPLRMQVREYERAGFHVIECAPCSGAHFKLRFAEFSEPQIVTKNLTDPRSIKNNLASYRRKQTQHKDGNGRTVNKPH